MAVFRGDRWRSGRTGRWVRNVTVAKQLKVPRSAVRATERYPKKLVEVTAVSRIRLPDRYIESLHRRVLVSPSRRELRQVRASLKRSVVKATKTHMGGKELEKYGKKVKARYEVRRRVTKAAAERKTEVRDIGVSPKDWDDAKKREYEEWWQKLGPKGRREMKKYLPVEVVAWLDKRKPRKLPPRDKLGRFKKRR